MTGEENKEILIPTQIEQALSKLHSEIDFASKMLNVKSDDYGNTLNSHITSFKSLLAKLEETLKQNKKQSEMIINEIAMLTLLPEKITSNISQIGPQIASAIEQMHQPRILEITNQFTSLCNKLTEDIANYENQLEKLTDNCTEQLSSTTQKFSANLEEKLNHFTDKLTTSSGLATTANSKTLLKNLAFVVIFSAAVSGITSYVVTTKFPRFVAITGANNLSIHDSRVEVWNSKKELDTKEHPNTRKLKN